MVEIWILILIIYLNTGAKYCTKFMKNAYEGDVILSDYIMAIGLFLLWPIFIPLPIIILIMIELADKLLEKFSRG